MHGYYDVTLIANDGPMSIYDILDRKKNRTDNNIRSYVVRNGIVYFYKDQIVTGLETPLIGVPLNSILYIMPIEED